MFDDVDVKALGDNNNPRSNKLQVVSTNYVGQIECMLVL